MKKISLLSISFVLLTILYAIIDLSPDLANASNQYYPSPSGHTPENIDIPAIQKKAIIDENNEAEHTLGDLYYFGLGLPQDFDEAFKWYRKAARHGYISEERKRGDRYYYGKEVPQDYRKAFKWYRKAAEQWDIPALFNLGQMYSNGLGIKQDYSEALQWFRKAAQLGDADSQYRLSRMYYSGIGVKQDLSKAAKWFRRANEQSSSTTEQASDTKIIAMVSGTAWPVIGGYVVTNYHVIAGREDISLIRLDGVKTKAVISTVDKTNDLALLRPVNKEIIPPALPLAAKKIRVGEQVFTIGYPHPDMMGGEPKITTGIINSQSGFKNDTHTYQISVPLQSGNSGGPLLNMQGEVVGVVTAKISAIKIFKWTGDLPQNVNYAVKSEYLRPLLASVEPIAVVQILPAKTSDLASLAERIEQSVMIVLAQPVKQ